MIKNKILIVVFILTGFCCIGRFPLPVGEERLIDLKVKNMVPLNLPINKTKHSKIIILYEVKASINFHPYSPNRRYDSRRKLNQKFVDTYKSAIEVSLKKYGFSIGKNKNKFNADYILKVNILKEEVPIIYSDLSIYFFVDYQIIDFKTKKIIYKETIKTCGLALLKETPSDLVQRTLALERATRKNIYEFIKEIDVVFSNVEKKQLD